MEESMELGKLAPLLDKWNFGFGRIIDFTAIAILAIRFRSVLKLLAIRPLVMIGQASLQVFCVHLLCVFFALTIMGNNAMLTGWPAAALVVLSLSALLLAAHIALRRKTRASATAVVRVNTAAHPPLSTRC